MSRVAVPVLKPLVYQGRSYVRGEMISLEATEALALAKRREVTLTRGAVVEQAKVETAHPRARRTYRRRDMVAEKTTE